MPHGGSRRGSGAPIGNFNALKKGRYSPRLIRGMAVLSLAPAVTEVLHALARNRRCFHRDPEAGARAHLSLVRAAQALAGRIVCADAVFVDALLEVVADHPAVLGWRPRRPTAARPWYDPTIALLLAAVDVASRDRAIASRLDRLTTQRLALAAAQRCAKNA
jgi:hypothetical protein